MPYDWLHVTPIDLEEPNESLQVTLAKKKITNPKTIKVPYFHFHPIFVPKPIPTLEKPKSTPPPVSTTRKQIFVSNLHL